MTLDPAALESLLSFWFGPLDAEGRADAEHQRRWFMKDAAFDDTLRRDFGALHAQVAALPPAGLPEGARARLACVITLDQLSRNLFRDTPGMFAHDAKALAWARQAVDAGDDTRVAAAERPFFYLPFMHSEAIEDQARCVALYAALPDFGNALDYARRHEAIVARFGRFPHRNALLGRDSTPDEQAFLREPGSSF